MRIEFDAAKHRYRIDGIAVPNVTRVLDDLFDWGSIPPGVLERKRQIGTAVHKAIELDAQDDLDESTLDPQIKGYFQGWQRFREERRFTCRLAERQVGCWKFRYAGTFDLFGDCSGEETLIDVKTSSKLHPASALQTAAYLHAASEMGLIHRSAKRFSLTLQNDGGYRLHPHGNKNDFAVFLSCLSRHNWRQAQGLIKEERS